MCELSSGLSGSGSDFRPYRLKPQRSNAIGVTVAPTVLHLISFLSHFVWPELPNAFRFSRTRNGSWINRGALKPSGFGGQAGGAAQEPPLGPGRQTFSSIARKCFVLL